MLTEAELANLVGQKLTAGTYRINPVESLMLTSVVHGKPTREPHPIYAFVAALAGIGIEELLATFGSAPTEGPMLGECELTTSVPFVAGLEYTVTGAVTSAVRKQGRVLGMFDLVTITLLVHDPASIVISTCSATFILPRAARKHVIVENPDMALPGGCLPTWSLSAVDPIRMHVMALLLKDPNVIHIDVEAVQALGLGDAPINQGPTNIGYLYNLLAQAYPGGQVTALKVRLLANVFAGDSVVAHGREAIESRGVHTCRVWLTSNGMTVADGTATIRVPPLDAVLGTVPPA